MTDISAFLAAVLPPNGPYVAASIAEGRTWQRSVDTVDGLEAENTRWLRKQRDCYFLVAAISDGSLKKGLRHKENIAGVRSLRVDLDVGGGKSYPTRADVERVIIHAVNQQLLPQPWIVNSGGGYHCYWPLAETLNPHAWEGLSNRFLHYLRNTCGIAVDDAACTTDSARILRMPGTINYKLPDNPREVALVVQGSPAVAAAQWVSVLDAAGTPVIPAGKQRVANVSQQLKGQLQRDLDEALNIPVDPNMVFAECQQMRFCREYPDKLSEPHWYAGLGVATYISEEVVIAVSEGHPDYSLDQALEKARQWRAAATGPTTCAKFFAINPAGCAGCVHATTVTSPIQLGKGIPRIIPVEQSAKQVIETPADVALPSEQTLTPDVTRGMASALLLQRAIELAAKMKLRVAADGVWGTRTDAASGETVPIRLWGPSPIVILAAQQIDGQYNLAVGYNLNMTAGTYEVKIVRSGALVGNSAVKEWAESFLVTAHPLMNDYLISWATLVAANPACELVGRYGFTDDTNTRFVLGDTVFTKDGETTALVRGDIMGGGKLPTYRAGDVSAWIKAAHAYSFPGAEPFACTVLSAFASPLVKLVNEHTPAALFLEGSTGRGKTTALRVAASVWGNYKTLEQGGGSTLPGLRLFATRMNSLPVYVDETRSGDAKIARNFLYDMSNGAGRITSTPGQNAIVKDPFTLITVVTSNSPASAYFFDSDKPINRNTDEGISARVLPLTVNADTARAGDEYMPYLSNLSLGRNYGMAGSYYIRFVLAHDVHVERIFREAHQYVRMAFAAAGVAGAGERAAVTIAALCAAGTTTNHMGLTAYDVASLRAYMVRAFLEWITERRVEYTASTDLADRFYELHHRSLSVIAQSGLMSRDAVLAPIVVYQGHAYFAAGPFERAATGWGLTRREAQTQMAQRGFVRGRPAFAQSVEYYRGPSGLYIASLEKGVTQ